VEAGEIQIGFALAASPQSKSSMNQSGAVPQL
jgi:hypothetical protein